MGRKEMGSKLVTGEEWNWKGGGRTDDIKGNERAKALLDSLDDTQGNGNGNGTGGEQIIEKGHTPTKHDPRATFHRLRVKSDQMLSESHKRIDS